MSDVQCPICGGPCWDQTKSKFWDPNKNAPIYKCKDKNCKGVIWPPKGGGTVPKPATSTSAAFGPASLAVLKPPVVPALAVKQHFEIINEVVLAWNALLTEAPQMVGQEMQEILHTATAETLAAIAATIAIGIQRNSR
jgi:hypothetical protein